MRYSSAFIPTQKEVPKDAVMPSHVLLLRAGYVRMVGAGIYEMLPLGMRVLHHVATIVREEMNRSGAQEVLMPALLPSDYFQESGRWESFGDILMRLRDRKGGDYHLGPTHEEIITDMVRRDIKSYRQLPLNLYQIQMKFRDEPRPRAGLLRCREFLMKDAYTFDMDDAAALESYGRMRDAYHRIFQRLGLSYRVVQADSGAMGGSTSAEFQVLAQNGEDAIVACRTCDYAANVEVAEARPTAPGDPSGDAALPMGKIHTPGAHTISEVVSFLRGRARPETMLKSLLYLAGDRVVMAVVRGDHDVNELKLARHLGVSEVFLATDADVERVTRAKVGFAGPVGFDGEILVDRAASRVRNGITGANETDHHLENVTFERDYRGKVAELRLVIDGDGCPKCDSHLQLYRGIEGGHIFVLGTHYSAKMGASYLDDSGTKHPVVMGCYGIGISRLVAAAVEQFHDDDGIAWPMPIAPFQVIITPIGKDEIAQQTAASLYDDLCRAGVDALLDDRDERPGVKFKDADLLGIPLRVTVGKRGLDAGALEVKKRTEREPSMVPTADVAATVSRLVVEMGGRLSPRVAE